MFSGTHYGIKVDMGWLKDDVDGLKQVVDFLNKDNIKFVLLPVANQRFKIDVDRVGALSPPTSHTTGHAVPHPAVQLT